MPQSGLKPGKFVWPPRSPVEVATAEPDADAEVAAAPVTAPALSGWRAALREIERVWLGLAVPPLAERLADAGWSPDDPSAYCARCGRTIGPHEADGSGCSVCRPRRLPWDRIVRLGPYRGELRRIVHEIKFTRWRRLGDDIGRLLGRELRERLEAAGIEPASVLLVPVPTSWRRRIARGIDHPLVIARGVAAEVGAEIAPLLERTHRPAQTSLPAGRRRENVEGSIRRRRGIQAPAGHLVVVDDVTTTRATLRGACRALRDAQPGSGPCTIWGAVLAVTPEPGDPAKTA
jgi:predicted amidophosphoribosyltransferase